LQDFRARAAEFDGVVTDLALRGMSGLDLAEGLCKIRPGIPVLMTSGYFGPEDSERARRLGIRELILKPNTLNELGSALHRVLKPSETHAAGTGTR
jgi:DNA-binding NarL/FixJ family response regulator